MPLAAAGASAEEASPPMPLDSAHLVRDAIFWAFLEAPKSVATLTVVVVGLMTNAEVKDKTDTAAIEASENFIVKFECVEIFTKCFAADENVPR